MYGQTPTRPTLRALTVLFWMLSYLCLSWLLLAACSGSPNRPNPGAKAAGSGRAETVGAEMVGKGNATALAGEGDMAIEKAFLRPGDGGDEIVVQEASFGADHAWRYVTYLTIGYMISRGLAKAGSRKPYRD